MLTISERNFGSQNSYWRKPLNQSAKRTADNIPALEVLGFSPYLIQPGLVDDLNIRAITHGGGLSSAVRFTANENLQQFSQHVRDFLKRLNTHHLSLITPDPLAFQTLFPT